MKKTKTSYLLRGTPSVLMVLGAGFVMASSADIRAALGMGTLPGNAPVEVQMVAAVGR